MRNKNINFFQSSVNNNWFIENYSLDLNDIIDNINKNTNQSTDTSISIESSIEYSPSNSSACSSDSSFDYKQYNKTSKNVNKYKELEKKYRNLIIINERLHKLLKKKSSSKKTNGIFSHWDLLIVIALGILMIIVLEYVYKIAMTKSI